MLLSIFQALELGDLHLQESSNQCVGYSDVYMSVRITSLWGIPIKDILFPAII